MKTLVHANHIIVVRKDYADLIDPVSGRWQRFNNQRAAKWSATVYYRLRSGFGQPVPDEKMVSRYFEPTKEVA